MRISIPRWAQLVLIPIVVVLVLYFGRAASHAIFVFLMSAIVALLLNPLAMAAGRIKLPRWAAVPLVYLIFIAAVVLIFVYLGPPLIRQLQKLVEEVPKWLDDLNGLLANMERWLAGNGIDAKLQFDTSDIGDWVQTHGAESVGALISVGRGVVSAVVNLFLTVVISFYMLIDGKRLYRWLCTLVPGDQGTKEDYVRGLQRAFSRYVRGQFFLGLVVGFFSGMVIWVLSWDVVGVWPDGGQWALLFGVWAGVTEVIPYVGPFLGAAPPVIGAFFWSPWAALVVIIAYVVIQQLESHVLAPNIVGTSVGVHPLLVIFALLAGAQIGGILGMIAALPILAMLKHTFTFYDIKFSRAPWVGDDGVVVSQAVMAGTAAPEASARPASSDMGPLAVKLAAKAKAVRKTVTTKAAEVGGKVTKARTGRRRRKSE